MSSNPTISSIVAQSLLPRLTYEQADAILSSRQLYSEHEKMVLYTHYLVARGHFGDLADYLDRLDASERRAIVNDALYDTYWGNALHACAYWNTGENALAIYRYLDAAGARPTRDYYEQLPWEVAGILYICPLRGRNVADGYERDCDEFNETHADIQRFFGHYVAPLPESEDERPSTPVCPPADELPPPPVEWFWGPSVSAAAGGSGVPTLQSACPLHRPGAPYSRNTDGYYGSHAPACNGCARGDSDEADCELADEVRRRTRSLLSLWGTRYTEYTAADVADLSVELLRAVNELGDRTTVVVTPQDYAERVIHMCDAAIALDAAMKINSGADDRDAAVRIRLEVFLALDDRRVLGNVESYPIVAAARALLVPRT